MFLMNDSIDQPIDRWDEMFLPDELEKAVDELTYIDQDRNRQNFVKSSYTYYQAKGIESVPVNAPIHWPLGLIIGLCSGGLVFLSWYFYINQIRPYSKLFPIIHILTGFVLGIPGTILMFMSFFTDHVVTYHNENIFLANPLTFLLIPLGFALLAKKNYARRWLPVTVYSLCALGGILLFFKFFPAFDQYNWLSIAIILPLMVSLAVSWLTITRNAKPESKISSSK
jgi:hypothetical protein